MRKYGTDKPDLRNPIEMQDVSEAFRGSGFKIFASILGRRCQEPGLGDSGAGRRQSRFRGSHELLGARRRAAGPRLHLLARGRGGRRRPARQEHRTRSAPSRSPRNSASGSATRCSSSRAIRSKFVKFAGPARTKVGEELGLIKKDRFEFCWIVDFPMFEWSEEEKKIDFSHNPFSMPNIEPENSSRSIRTTRTRCSISRRSSTISSATASSCRPARCVTIART